MLDAIHDMVGWLLAQQRQGGWMRSSDWLTLGLGEVL
jgi:hypothetical protein